MKAIYLKFKEFKPYLMVGIAAWLAGIASNAMWDTITVWRNGSLGRFSPWNCLCIALIYFSGWCVYSQRGVFFKPRTRYLKDILSVPPRKYLILFLSHLNPQYGPYENGIPNWLLPLSDPPDLPADFQKMIGVKKSQEKFWTWEMPLRAIHHHGQKVLKVILICSDATTSMGAAHQFVSICKRYEAFKDIQFYVYCQRRSQLMEAPESAIAKEEGLNFDSFDQLSDAVWHVLEKLRRWKAKENEIAIDFTGGLKVTSVVAAATTFNRQINAQYVHTASCQVVGYDVIMASSEKKEHEVDGL